MVSIPEPLSALIDLGERLRARRIELGQTQRVFAERIGVSIPTLRAMEAGRPTVAVSHWANAMWALGRLDDLAAALRPKESLFARAQLEQSLRKRARQRVRLRS